MICMFKGTSYCIVWGSIKMADNQVKIQYSGDLHLIWCNTVQVTRKTSIHCQQEKGSYADRIRTFPRCLKIYLQAPGLSQPVSVTSTDVCKTLTFITSTCRSSLSEGVTLTAFSIWLSNCFSSESVSTDTNLSSDSSFCKETEAL